MRITFYAIELKCNEIAVAISISFGARNYGDKDKITADIFNGGRAYSFFGRVLILFSFVNGRP